MKKVLILNPYFFPGYRSGGPQQTIKNICDVYGEQCEIYLLTQNHDFGVAEQYEGIETRKWIAWNNIKIMYLNSREYGYREFKKVYQEFDTIYTCGMFEKNTYMMLLVHKLRQEKKHLYVAPMGVFSEGAMSMRTLKKQLFFKVLRMFGLLKDIKWSFTSKLEYDDACNTLGSNTIGQNYIFAEDLPRKIDYGVCLSIVTNSSKLPGKLRVIFLSRICPKKNLAQCINILSADYQGEIVFDVYGVKEDEVYWNKCLEMSKQLPSNVQFNYRGDVESSKVVEVFGRYDVFLFPTKGENFGHVIFEALAAGCIPLLSDTTPWRDLDKYGCGNVVELQNTEKFQLCVKQWLATDNNEMQNAKINAIEYACNKYEKSVEQNGYREVFLDL